MQRTLVLGLILLSVVASSAEQVAAHPEMLVSTEWLAAHLQDKDLVLLQIGPERSEYEAGHIPRAQFLANKEIFFDQDRLSVEKLTARIRSLGISDGSHIVIYSSKWPTIATRLYWMLDYLGLAGNASLLDGGIDQWKKEKRELSREIVKPPAPGNAVAHPHPYVLAESSDVAGLPADSVLIDSRPQKRYLDGHIPGAISLYWQQTTLDDAMNTFLEPEKLAKVYESAGVKRGSPVISYCDIGFQATHAYFTLKYLGYDVRMYDGSYSDWNGKKHLPVTTGDKPK